MTEPAVSNRRSAGAPKASSSGEFTQVAGDSVVVAGWTIVSRITGFGRVAAIAAVLGPTYFGNLFEATNFLPVIVHQLLTGSLITALLVPPLVKHIDQNDRLATSRIAGGFLGFALLVFTAVVGVIIVAGQLVLYLLTIGVEDAAVGADQRRLGWPLLALLMPQVLLYASAAVAVAVQNAHRRFALAAAAPALENIGVIAVLVASGLLFGVGRSVDEVTMGHVVFLGVGTTAAVALHAAAQWWGAYRVGIALVPRAGWRNPEVRGVIRMAVPSSGYAGLNAVRHFGVLVAAGSVAGGVVAYQIGFQFLNLAVALSAKPVAAAQLPHLARRFNENLAARFHSEYRQGLFLSLFVAVPASLLFLGMAQPLARAVSFGEMATSTGIGLVAASIAALSPGIVGMAAFTTATAASYARRDAGAPLAATAQRVALSFVGISFAVVALDGVSVLVALALTVALSDLWAGVYLNRRLGRGLPAVTDGRYRRLLGDFAAGAAAAIPAAAVAYLVPTILDGAAGRFLGIGVGTTLAAVLYLSIQRMRSSAELNSLVAVFKGPGSTSDVLGSASVSGWAGPS